ncbi:MAG: methyltransferase domain-containing protein, partial [Candidatus Omnitrophota bacterium]|nr:methyltransferase domain-containing protein [Candidatus Omnitrophota bacterium]
MNNGGKVSEEARAKISGGEEIVGIVNIGGCFDRRAGISAITQDKIQELHEKLRKDFNIELALNIDGMRFQPPQESILDPLDFANAVQYRQAVIAEAKKNPGSIYEEAIYCYRSLRVRCPEAYLLAALRESNTRQKAGELSTLLEAVHFVRQIEGQESIFGTTERIAMPDEVIFKGGNHRDKALLLYALLWHMGIASTDELGIVFDADASYVLCKGVYVNTVTWESRQNLDAGSQVQAIKLSSSNIDMRSYTPSKSSAARTKDDSFSASVSSRQSIAYNQLPPALGNELMPDKPRYRMALPGADPANGYVRLCYGRLEHLGLLQDAGAFPEGRYIRRSGRGCWIDPHRADWRNPAPAGQDLAMVSMCGMTLSQQDRRDYFSPRPEEFDPDRREFIQKFGGIVRIPKSACFLKGHELRNFILHLDALDTDFLDTFEMFGIAGNKGGFVLVGSGGNERIHQTAAVFSPEPRGDSDNRRGNIHYRKDTQEGNNLLFLAGVEAGQAQELVLVDNGDTGPNFLVFDTFEEGSDGCVAAQVVYDNVGVYKVFHSLIVAPRFINSPFLAQFVFHRSALGVGRAQYPGTLSDGIEGMREVGFMGSSLYQHPFNALYLLLKHFQGSDYVCVHLDPPLPSKKDTTLFRVSQANKAKPAETAEPAHYRAAPLVDDSRSAGEFSEDGVRQLLENVSFGSGRARIRFNRGDSKVRSSAARAGPGKGGKDRNVSNSPDFEAAIKRLLKESPAITTPVALLEYLENNHPDILAMMPPQKEVKLRYLASLAADEFQAKIDLLMVDYREKIAGAASGEELKRIYRSLAQKLHPDKNLGNEKMAGAAFIELTRDIQERSAGAFPEIVSDIKNLADKWLKFVTFYGCGESRPLMEGPVVELLKGKTDAEEQIKRVSSLAVGDIAYISLPSANPESLSLVALPNIMIKRIMVLGQLTSKTPLSYIGIYPPITGSTITDSDITDGWGMNDTPSLKNLLNPPLEHITLEELKQGRVKVAREPFYQVLATHSGAPYVARIGDVIQFNFQGGSFASLKGKKILTSATVIGVKRGSLYFRLSSFGAVEDFNDVYRLVLHPSKSEEARQINVSVSTIRMGVEKGYIRIITKSRNAGYLKGKKGRSGGTRRGTTGPTQGSSYYRCYPFGGRTCPGEDGDPGSFDPTDLISPRVNKLGPFSPRNHRDGLPDPRPAAPAGRGKDSGKRTSALLKLASKLRLIVIIGLFLILPFQSLKAQVLENPCSDCGQETIDCSGTTDPNDFEGRIRGLKDELSVMKREIYDVNYGIKKLKRQLKQDSDSVVKIKDNIDQFQQEFNAWCKQFKKGMKTMWYWIFGVFCGLPVLLFPFLVFLMKYIKSINRPDNKPSARELGKGARRGIVRITPLVVVVAFAAVTVVALTHFGGWTGLCEAAAQQWQHFVNLIQPHAAAGAQGLLGQYAGIGAWLGLACLAGGMRDSDNTHRRAAPAGRAFALFSWLGGYLARTGRIGGGLPEKEIEQLLARLRRMELMFTVYQEILSNYGRETWRRVANIIGEIKGNNFSLIGEADKVLALMPDPQHIDIETGGEKNWIDWFDLKDIDISAPHTSRFCMQPCQHCSRGNGFFAARHWPAPIVIRKIEREGLKVEVGSQRDEFLRRGDPFFRIHSDGYVEFALRSGKQIDLDITTVGWDKDDARTQTATENIINLFSSDSISDEMKNKCFFQLSLHLCSPRYGLIQAIYKTGGRRVPRRLIKAYVRRYLNIIKTLGPLLRDIYVELTPSPSLLNRATVKILSKVLKRAGIKYSDRKSFVSAIVEREISSGSYSNGLPQFFIDYLKYPNEFGKLAILTVRIKEEKGRGGDFLRRLKLAEQAGPLCLKIDMEAVTDMNPIPLVFPEVMVTAGGKVIVKSVADSAETLVESSLDELDPVDHPAMRSFFGPILKRISPLLSFSISPTQGQGKGVRRGIAGSMWLLGILIVPLIAAAFWYFGGAQLYAAAGQHLPPLAGLIQPHAAAGAQGLMSAPWGLFGLVCLAGGMKASNGDRSVITKVPGDVPPSTTLHVSNPNRNSQLRAPERPLGMIYWWWRFLDNLGLIRGDNFQARLKRMAQIAHREEWFFSFFLLNIVPVAVTLFLLWPSLVVLGWWGIFFTFKFWKILWITTPILYVISAILFGQAHTYIYRWKDKEVFPIGPAEPGDHLYFWWKGLGFRWPYLIPVIGQLAGFPYAFHRHKYYNNVAAFKNNGRIAAIFPDAGRGGRAAEEGQPKSNEASSDSTVCCHYRDGSPNPAASAPVGRNRQEGNHNPLNGDRKENGGVIPGGTSRLDSFLPQGLRDNTSMQMICGLNDHEWHNLSLILDPAIQYGNAVFDRDGPLNHVEDKIWNVLLGVSNYGQNSRDRDPYLYPKAYVLRMLSLFYLFRHYMKQDGRYDYLVNWGLEPCLKRHLNNLREKARLLPLRKGYAESISRIVEYFYRIIFDIYKTEMKSFWDFDHHREGEMFEGQGDPDHLEAFREELARGRHGIRALVRPYVRGAQQELYCLEKEAEIYRQRINKSGVAFDPDTEVTASHVVYGDPVQMKAYFNPFTTQVYSCCMNSKQSRTIRAYLERIIPACAGTIVEIGSGAGALGRVLEESPLKNGLEGIEWNKAAIKKAQGSKWGKYVKEGSVYHLPYFNNSVGALISLESMDTFEDQARALSEIRRVLKDGAPFVHIAIMAPNPELCEKLMKKRGIKLFSVSVGMYGMRYFYFSSRQDAGTYLRLCRELKVSRGFDAGASDREFGYYYEWPDRQWPPEATRKHAEWLEFRNSHMTVFGPHIFCEILKDEAVEFLRFSEEVISDGVNFCLFKQIALFEASSSAGRVASRKIPEIPGTRYLIPGFCTPTAARGRASNCSHPRLPVPEPGLYARRQSSCGLFNSPFSFPGTGRLVVRHNNNELRDSSAAAAGQREDGEMPNASEKQSVSVLDINTPGLLLHGKRQKGDAAGRETNRERLIDILSEGIKPWDKVSRVFLPTNYENDPDAGYRGHVSLSMVNRYGGYEGCSIRRIYGPRLTENQMFPGLYEGIDCNVVFILDSSWVEINVDKFEAIGTGFGDSTGYIYYPYREHCRVFHGIKCGEMLFSSFWDEVLYEGIIPPEAIAAIITSNEYAPELRDIITQRFPRRFMRIFNPQGQLLFDIGNSSGAAASAPAGPDKREPNNACRKSSGSIILERLVAEVLDEIRPNTPEGVRVASERIKSRVLREVDPAQAGALIKEITAEIQKFQDRRGIVGFFYRAAVALAVPTPGLKTAVSLCLPRVGMDDLDVFGQVLAREGYDGLAIGNEIVMRAANKDFALRYPGENCGRTSDKKRLITKNLITSVNISTIVSRAHSMLPPEIVEAAEKGILRLGMPKVQFQWEVRKRVTRFASEAIEEESQLIPEKRKGQKERPGKTTALVLVPSVLNELENLRANGVKQICAINEMYSGTIVQIEIEQAEYFARSRQLFYENGLFFLFGSGKPAAPAGHESAMGVSSAVDAQNEEKAASKKRNPAVLDREVENLLRIYQAKISGKGIYIVADIMHLSPQRLWQYLKKYPEAYSVYDIKKMKTIAAVLERAAGKISLDCLTVPQAATKLGVSAGNLYRYFQKHPDELDKYGVIMVDNYSWDSLDQAIKNIHHAFVRYKPDMLTQYKKLRTLSEAELRALRKDIYSITEGHFFLWGISNAIAPRAGDRLIEYFHHSHIEVLKAAFPDLNLDRLGFGLKWETPDECAASIRYVVSEHMPDLVRRYDVLDERDAEAREALQDEFYKLSKDHFSMWNVQAPFNRKVAPEFKGSYIEMLKVVFPKLKLNDLGFKLDWSALERALASVRFVLSRKIPHIVRSCDRIWKLTKEEVGTLRENILSITAAHFTAWGLAIILQKKRIKFFNGTHYEALMAIFNDPRLGLSKGAFIRRRAQNFAKIYVWTAGLEQGKDNVRDAVGTHHPDIIERYGRLDELNEDQREHLREDIYKISQGFFLTYGLKGALRQDYFHRNYKQALIASFENLGLNSLGFDLDWASPEQRLETIRYVLSKKAPDRIMERYRNLRALTSSQVKVLAGDIYSIGQGCFRAWGLSSALNRNIAPEFKGSYIEALRATFSDLRLDPLGFQLDWKTKARADASIRFTVFREVPLIEELYENIDKISEQQLQQLTGQIYRITHAHFCCWGLNQALHKKAVKYYDGNHIKALQEAFAHSRLQLAGGKFLKHILKMHNVEFSEKQLPEELVREYLPIMQGLSSNYARKTGVGDPLMYVSGAYAGLREIFEGVQSSDPRFKPFAITRMKQRIIDQIHKEGRLKPSEMSQLKKIQTVRESLMQAGNVNPSMEDIARDCGLRVSRVRSLLQKKQTVFFS